MMKLKDLSLGYSSNKASIVQNVQKVDNRDIAIIGMAGYFPGSETLDEFWTNLCDGKDLIVELPEDRKMDLDRYLDFKNVPNPGYVKAGYVKNVDTFDFHFFGLSPAEAKAMDPNQRLFLEVAWKAIEDAGYGGTRLVGSETGVYVGFSGNAGGLYQNYVQDISPELENVAGGLNAIIGSRISYLLDLKGPSMLIDSSCSSSLVAIHTACKAIRNGDCEAAICGGVNLNLLPTESGNKIGIESSTSKVRAFAEGADGTVSGEGAAAIMLKSLHAAQSEGDHIYAIIKGSAINQDGKSAGITTPNVAAQEEVLLKAWKDARIEPSTISYIEAHGTGTKIGDPIEVEALTRAMRKFTDQKQFCGIGSLKSNIGHLDAAAGIAGVIKSVLSLKHKLIPPSLHFDCPNKLIDFINSPFYVNQALSQWGDNDVVRRCGVSAFGMSGTNCHLVLEAYDTKTLQTADTSHLNENSINVLAISARNSEVLYVLLKTYKSFLSLNPDVDLKGMCYTINTGRGHYSERILVFFTDYEDLLRKLDLCLVAPFDRFVLPTKLGLYEPFRDLFNQYLQGEQVDLRDVYNAPVNKISLPSYPFERIRCWLEIDKNKCVDETFSNGTSIKTVQQTVNQVWKEVLGYNEINEDANFYELGGDSIYALKIVNKLRDHLQVDLEISKLFVHPTISEFTNYVETKSDPMRQIKSYDPVVKNKGFIPLTFAQRGIFYALQRSKLNTSYNMPGSLDIFGEIDLERLEDSLHTLVKLHQHLQASFHFVKQEPMQKIEEYEFEIEHLHLGNNDIESLYRDFVRPFDISTEILIRVGIVHCSSDHYCVFFDVHHLVSDGVSMNILMEDFVSLYLGKNLEVVSHSYQDYIFWQQSKEGLQIFDEQERFWLEHLKGKLPVLDMPMDYSRPDIREGTGDEVGIDLDSALTSQVREKAMAEGVTTFTFLFAVYALLLHKFSGQEDIIIGTPTSGRSRSEWERVVGMFVNTLALRVKPKQDQTFKEFLHSVREIIHNALNYQSYPFELIAQKAEYSHDINRNPVFDTMFIMQNNKSNIMNIDNLSFVSKQFSNDTAKFDFKMEVYESPEKLGIVLDYSTELYRESTIQLWLNNYLHLIKEICSNSNVRLRDIFLIESSRNDKAFLDFNDDLN
nr:condensation domain-containing protein [Paenibacillus xylanexedens]